MNTAIDKKNKNATIQGIRFLAFMQVFLFHVKNMHPFNIVCSAPFAVSFFIVLSGFLYGTRYKKYSEKTSFYNNVKNALKKISKWYPFHIAALIAVIPMTDFFWLLSAKDMEGLKIWFGKFITNVFLIQNWFTTDYFKFNGLSWFLSMLAFILVLMPYLARYFSKLLDRGLIYVVFAFIIINLCDLFYSWYIMKIGLHQEYWLYIFPVSRIPEFADGMLAGMIFCCLSQKQYLDKINIWIANILELAAAAMVVYLIGFAKFPQWLWRHWVWIIPGCLVLFVFTMEKGFLSKILGCRLLKYLGDISFELFILHTVIIKYINKTINCDKISDFGKGGVLVFTFILVFMAANIIHNVNWQKFYKDIADILKNRG